MKLQLPYLLVLDYLSKVDSLKESAKDIALNKKAGFNFHNRSQFDFDKLIADPNNVAANLRNFINGFSTSAREIIEYFNFDDQIDRMDDPKADILFRVVKAFQEIDLSEDDPMIMGYIFEDLIRRFSEQSNETAGEHFTPREVIRLMVNVLFNEDSETLTKEGIVKTMYDPACGTGGMLSVAEQHLNELNAKAELKVFGQEINPESYAICKSDMLIKGQNPANIKFGNTFTVDGLEEEKFDYMLSNPPFGVDWKKAQKIIKAELELALCLMVRLCLQVLPKAEKATSENGLLKMTGWKPSLHYLTNSFTTQVFQRTSGLLPIRKVQHAKVKCS